MEIKLTDEQIKALQSGEDITIKAPCKKVKPWPQKGDKYWYYTQYGRIGDIKAIDSDGRLNAYKTEQEAKQALKLAQAKQRLKHAIAEANDGWTPNWKNIDIIKYLFIAESTGVSIDYYYGYKCQSNWMYMKSHTIAKHILAEHKADIELILSE